MSSAKDDNKPISSYGRNFIIVSDNKLRGKKIAEMYDGDNIIRVSPAMYSLLKTDRDYVLENLKVRILPNNKDGQ
jgi:hypothetical protein